MPTSNQGIPVDIPPHIQSAVDQVAHAAKAANHTCPKPEYTVYLFPDRVTANCKTCKKVVATVALPTSEEQLINQVADPNDPAEILKRLPK